MDPSHPWTMIDVGLTIKIDSFNGAMKEMSKRLKRHATHQQIVEAEVSKVLEKAISGTDTATVTGIRKDFSNQEWTTYNGKKYRLDWRFPNALWGGIGGARKANLQRRLAARGLAKRSFHALGLTFGQDVKAPAFVKKAIAKGHTSAENVRSQTKNSGDSFGIRIENHSPLLRYAGARKAFFSSVAGRVNFFAKNLAKGVFDDLKQVAAKYPGIKFTP